MHQAILWETLPDNKVKCNACSFHCTIAEGGKGNCQVRQNMNGQLVSLNYDAICATGIDPIEKKPLFHFQPGRRTFSIAAQGCNFQCDFCQNWQISQSPRMKPNLNGQSYTPENIVSAAYDHACTSIAYTYTEPTIFIELASECGKIAKERGLANVFVSNGYMSQQTIDHCAGFLDAINVDLKAFTDDFYRTHCKASLQPVLDTLKYLVHNTDIWLEVTTLVIPGTNDSDDELIRMAEFIAEDLGRHVPWHLSRFHPSFNSTADTITPAETLQKAYQYGKDAGLRYVYVGNMPGNTLESTYCHECGQRLIERVGYQITQFNALNSTCPDCGTKLAGVDMNPVLY